MVRPGGLLPVLAVINNMTGNIAALIFLFAILMAPQHFFAQSVTIERQVVCSFSMDVSTTTHHFNMNAGQPDYATLTQGEGFLTQGFNQPIEHFEPELEYTITLDHCTNEYTIAITVAGCTGENDILVMWNNEPGENTYTTTDTTVVLGLFNSLFCNATDTLVFSQEDVTEIFCLTEFYQLITPNNDGANDAWIIENVAKNLPENLVRIYNRWGQQVWQGRNYDNHNVMWTGRTNTGNELPDGTYYYTVEASEQAWSGFVELHR